MSRQKIRVLLLVALPWLISACGAASAAPAPAAAISDVKIASYSASIDVRPGQPTSVSASCKAGEQMVGGGFGASNIFEYDAFVEASYPSSANTWTVTGGHSPEFQLEVEVYCVQIAIPLGIQRVQANVAPSGSAACPQGTVVLSGGFQGSGPIQAAYPRGNGWYGASFDASEHVYALCAAQHVLRGSAVTSTFNVYSSTHSYTPGEGRVQCPARQVATGGGFDSEGDLILGSGMVAAPSSGWSVEAGGDVNVTVYAACVSFSG